MGPAGVNVSMVGGRYTVVQYNLSGGGTGSADFCFEVVIHVGVNGEDGEGNAHRIIQEDRGEEGVENHKWDMVVTGVHRGVEDGWDADIIYIYCPQKEKGVPVGGTKSNIQSLCKGKGV